MKKLFRILLILLGIIILGFAGLLLYITQALPNVGPAPDIKVEATPERIERGHYLANFVMGCVTCHSVRDWNTFAGPVVAGTEGQGGELFDQKLGFPGIYSAKNITPAGLKSWTDGEIFRAITTGVNKDEKPLFPIMPHPNFGLLDSSDILSVIAYVRTLPNIDHEVAKSSSDFPMNFIIHLIPQKAHLAPIPSKSNKVDYGKYLVTAASCHTCHTKEEKGKFVGPDFGGGREFYLNDGLILRSANITPSKTGIGAWTEEMFLKKFKDFADSNYVAPKISEIGYQTLMPWTSFAQMTNEDLSSIYAYLKTLHPVDNFVLKVDKKG
ncbi:MAG: cytochrome c [Saprospiraceae bacterium]